MLYVLQYVAVICAFLLPWGILGFVDARKAGNLRKQRVYGILALVTVAVVGVTVGLAFALK